MPISDHKSNIYWRNFRNRITMQRKMQVIYATIQRKPVFYTLIYFLSIFSLMYIFSYKFRSFFMHPFVNVIFEMELIEECFYFNFKQKNIYRLVW